MSKELIPLEAFENIVVDLTPHLKEANKAEIKTVGKALKRLTYIDENKIYCISENYLQDIKKIKAFDIIKEKVQFEFLEEREEGKIIQRYFVIGNRMFDVTEEEFDLLKEVWL